LEIEADLVRRFVLQIVILLSRQTARTKPQRINRRASANLMAQLSQTSHTGASSQFVLGGWGWCLGSSGFKREMLLRMESGLGEYHSGELRQGSARAKAEGIVAEELKRVGWKEADPKSRRENDPDKLEIAAWLRRETTPTIKAIAARLSLGTPKAAKAELHRHMQEGANPRKGKARRTGRRA
jgi:hypothetical protein